MYFIFIFLNIIMLASKMAPNWSYFPNIHTFMQTPPILTRANLWPRGYCGYNAVTSKLDHKSHCIFFLVLLDHSLWENLAGIYWGHTSSPVENPMRKATEVFFQEPAPSSQPCEWVTLESGLSVQVKPSHNWSSTIW